MHHCACDLGANPLKTLRLVTFGIPKYIYFWFESFFFYWVSLWEMILFLLKMNFDFIFLFWIWIWIGNVLFNFIILIYSSPKLFFSRKSLVFLVQCWIRQVQLRIYRMAMEIFGNGNLVAHRYFSWRISVNRREKHQNQLDYWFGLGYFFSQLFCFN